MNSNILSRRQAAIDCPVHPLVVGLFGLSLTELILGGGGRCFDWGFLTPRMVLFGACQLTWLLSWVRGRFNPGVRIWVLTLFSLCVLFLSAGIGLFNGAGKTAVFTDIKPLLFILNLPFYTLVLRDPTARAITAHLFRWLGLALAISYLTYWALWQSNLLDGWAFYQGTESTGEFFFRGNMGFFYKGFVFLPVALFFWEITHIRWKRWIQILIYAAILLTFTRAIWLILLFFPLRALWISRGHNRLAWIAIVLMLAGPWLLEKGVVETRGEREFPEIKGALYPNQDYLDQYPYPRWQRAIAFAFGQGIENRQYSMMERFVQFDEVVQRIGPSSLFFGHGFGIGTPLKPIHMEISYLEIFHKQGLVGLMMWGLLFVAIWVQFRRSTVMPFVERSLSIALLHAAFLIFALSFFNPFINSPMGLAVLSLSIALPHHFNNRHGRLSASVSRPDRPVTSVCMATYNGSKWLREQLDSILVQLQAGDELLVADDASSDETPDILQEYIKRGEPIRVIPAHSEPIRHPSYNLERALSVARGEYIFLSDQDDVWLPGKLDAVCKALQNHTLVIHDARVTDEALNTISDSFFEMHNSRPGAIENFVRNNYLGCCMAFRKSLCSKALPFPTNLAMHDIWLGNVAALWFDTHFLPEIFVLYRRHSGTASTTTYTSRYTVRQKIQLRWLLVCQIGRNLLKNS
jgi:glycosyltransferase involved in cell wall biosynthesis